MEKDCSDEATNLVDRTSRAISGKDMRASGQKRLLHESDDSGGDDNKQPKLLDLCPSWMG